MEVWCQDLEKFHTAECILQGSVYFSVYQNVSLIDHWYLHSKRSSQFWSVVHKLVKVHNDTECVFLSPLNVLSTPIPFGIKTGII